MNYRFSGDEVAFLKAWPEASRGFSVLFKAITDDHKVKGLTKARKSRYGSPESRARDG